MLELFKDWNIYFIQGRTNKLVDGCYSFWQGGIFPLMHRLLQEEGENLRRRNAILETILMVLASKDSF